MTGGVETEVQCVFLGEEVCEEIQGDYVSRPLLLSHFMAFYRYHQGATRAIRGKIPLPSSFGLDEMANR